MNGVFFFILRIFLNLKRNICLFFFPLFSHQNIVGGGRKSFYVNLKQFYFSVLELPWIQELIIYINLKTMPQQLRDRL